jgi:hypothetical protein
MARLVKETREGSEEQEGGIVRGPSVILILDHTMKRSGLKCSEQEGGMRREAREERRGMG